MSTIRERFKLSTLSLAIVSSCSMQAFAFEEEAPKAKEKEKEQIEVIEVSGYRGSLLKSLNNKRHSNNVTDSIFAEDIGKSTDQNIADALSRVTGVSIQSDNGEGTAITVRGANPNQNVITLNGVQLTSNDDNQSVDLSSYSADILSKIEVVKTPSADHDEGALGAVVNLSSIKPLDQAKPIRTMTLQGRYNDYSEEGDHKISGTFSDMYLDETLGFAVTVFDETQATRRDSTQINPQDLQAIPVSRASDLDGNLITDAHAITFSGQRYDLHQSERNRQGGSIVLQYLPTDETEITFDANYSKQERVNVSNGVYIRPRADEDNFEADVLHGVSPTYGDWVPTFSDPQEDWWVIDNNHTLVKQLGRFGDGGYNTADGGSEVENTTLQLTLTQYIGDDIKVDLGVNSSSTTEQSLPSTYINMATWNSVPLPSLAKAGPYGTPNTGIQPVGYDCTSGNCEFVFGDGISYEGDIANKDDNFATTGFNPDDRATTHIGFLGRTVTDVEDTQDTAFVDVDWEVELGPITKVEFGAKYSKRDKYVDRQSSTFDSVAQGTSISIYNNEGQVVGTRTLVPGGQINNIRGSEIASDQPFPVDNFLENLGYARNAITDGWPLVDPNLAMQQALGSTNAEIEIDNSKTAGATLENTAAYIKFNFELAENITGDVGLRYVKTEVEADAFSAANYMTDPLNTHRIFDPFYALQLRNSANPLCGGGATPVPSTGPYTDVDGNEFSLVDPSGEALAYHRFDGQGWNLNGTSRHINGVSDYSDDVRLEKTMEPGDLCYDPYTDTYNGDPTASVSWTNLARHSDLSTSQNYHFYSDVRPTITDDNIIEVTDNRSKTSFATNDVNSYDMYLPSLNVNWAVTDDFISRFSVSKTMSRPNISSLNPGFALGEGAWGNPRNNTIVLKDTRLKPQESENLDISLEWYFNETSMLSAAFFHKKMTNFEEKVNFKSYADDLRLLDFSNGYDVSQLLRTETQVIADFDADRASGGSFMDICMPKRAQAPHTADSWFQSGDIDSEGVTNAQLLEKCALFSVEKLRNGKGATITGLELGYSQTYDFLPGIWSGLGIQANYTYQESARDLEINDETGEFYPEMPQAWTPKHSYNATLFWEQNGHQLRLSYRGKSDELMQQTWGEGSLWREGAGSFDFSASYKINENASLSFHALNLTDTVTRNYITSRSLWLGDYETDETGEQVLNESGQPIKIRLNEGNALEGDAYTGRTQSEYTTGRIYRLSLRVSF